MFEQYWRGYGPSSIYLGEKVDQFDPLVEKELFIEKDKHMTKLTHWFGLFSIPHPPI